MNPGMDLSAQIWNWYAVFFYTMGAMLALASALVFAVLTSHWLFLCARNIESKPTPATLIPAVLRLSAFQALVLGAVLIPLGVIVIYYLFSSLAGKLAPTPVEAPPLDLGAMSFDEQIATMASLLLGLFALAAVISGTTFLLLRYRARRINPQAGSLGFAKKLLRTYFHDSVWVGFSLALIACPVLWFFLYNSALLILIVLPAARQGLPKIAFPQAGQVYIKGLEFIGSWLLLLLLLPAIVLLLRGALLRWRFTIENPFLHLIFMRSLKFTMIGFLGWLGCVSMYFLSDSVYKLMIRLTVG